jgi:hypothetical protein
MRKVISSYSLNIPIAKIRKREVKSPGKEKKGNCILPALIIVDEVLPKLAIML